MKEQRVEERMGEERRKGREGDKGAREGEREQERGRGGGKTETERKREGTSH